MRRKFLVTGLGLLTLAAFLCGIVGVAGAAAKPSKAVANKPAAVAAKPVVTTEQFKIINPRPSKPPINAIALSPRLASLEGKTIAVVANYDEAMAPLAAQVAKTVKGSKVLFISDLIVAVGQTTHPIKLDAPGVTNMSFADFDKNPKQADAIIVGNGF